MFGFFLPNAGPTGPIKPEVTKTIDDIEIGSIWKDSKDDSLWRVVHKDRWVHVLSVADSELNEHGVNIFFASFSVVEYGAVCHSCKKKYQYAEKKCGFECWSCRNGA